jgi:hypothetical protein
MAGDQPLIRGCRHFFSSYSTWTLHYDVAMPEKSALTTYDELALKAGWTRCPRFEGGPELEVAGCWIKGEYTIHY